MITKSNITKKKKRVLGLLVLGILAIFLVGCTKENNTTIVQGSQKIQSDQSKENQNNHNTPPEGNFSPGNGPMLSIDGNFTPNNKQMPPEGNFSPNDRPMPPQDGNFTPGERPNFPRDGNYTPINK